METTMITNDNFSDTIIKTIDCHTIESVPNSAFFLEEHVFNGSEYYTVSKDEVLLKCFSTYNEAKYFLDRVSC